MKKLLVVFLFILLSLMVFPQTYATTDDGRRVILYPDGRWQWAQPTPGPTPSPSQNLSGTWTFSWKLGVFDESIDVEIRQFSDSLTLIWKIHVYDDTIEVPWQPGQDLQFYARSFFHDRVFFKGHVEDNRTITGTVSSEGAFPKTGTFRGVRK